MKYTLGADPELFMTDRAGQLRAACGRIGGTKEQPQPMGIGDGFYVQEDNVAIEFNIPPAHNAPEFQEHLQRAIKELADGVQKMYDFQIVNISAAEFPEEELKSPAAKVFGCDPDYNAWTGRRNPRPSAVSANLRSCGGHVHVGYDKRAVEPREVIKAMDLFLGVPSVLMDSGELRKQLYGKSGAHRVKEPYGVEYRTLSNFWVFSPRLIEWVWDNTGKALNAAELRLVDFDQEQEAIQSAIDNNDKNMARKLVDKYKLEVLSV